MKKLGGLKIGDLGISKSVAIMTKNSSNFPGTVNYMSPEIIKEDRNYTNKIDVWALGCVIYELITLEKLFDDVIGINIGLKILKSHIEIPEDIDETLGLILKG